MTTTTTETDELARLALGGRALKNPRLRRALITRLLNANGESENGEEPDEAEEGGDDDRELVRLLTASRLFKRRRVRRALLAHLLRARGAAESEGEEGEEQFEESGTDERDLIRVLIASRMFRRRRVRRVLLAHLLQVKGAGEAEGEGEEGDEESEEEGGTEEHELVRALIASRILKRRRVRRAILAHLLRERDEAVA